VGVERKMTGNGAAKPLFLGSKTNDFCFPYSLKAKRLLKIKPLDV
jgi:hypothetical protein